MANLHAYLSIIVVLVLTGCGLPVPEEVPIMAAGAASSLDKLNVWFAFAACVTGALLGDLVIYLIGYHFGHSLIKRHPRFAHLLHAENEHKTEALISQHGLKILFISRFMVGVRAPVYLAAGVLRMSLRRFLLTDALCATSVVSVFFGLSYFFGDKIAGWLKKGEYGLTVLIILVVLGVLIFTWRKGKKMMADISAADAPVHDSSASDSSASDSSSNGANHRDSMSQTKSLAS